MAIFQCEQLKCFYSNLYYSFLVFQKAGIICGCKYQNRKMSYWTNMSTHQERDGLHKMQKSIPRFFVSFFIFSFLPCFLPFFTISPCLLPLHTLAHPLLATTLRSTEAKSLQRQNGDHYIVRNYSSAQGNSGLSGDLRLLKLTSTLQ